MIEAVVKSVSEIQTDDHGYTFIELELSNGAQGFFPNKKEFLELFYEGMEVTYREVKQFNNRPKIVGLLPNKKQTKTKKMLVGKIVGLTLPWAYSQKNNKFYTELTLDDETKGIVMVDNKDETAKFKVGEVITYELTEAKGTQFIVGATVLGYSSAVERDLSIKKQTAFKAAVELFNANPHKGRWINKDSPSGLDMEAMVKDVEELTNRLLTIVN